MDIELDTGETLRFFPEGPASIKVEKGEELDAEKYAYLKEESGRFGALQAGLKYLGPRARSTGEMKLYLVSRRGFTAEAAAFAMHRLTELGYLNDADFSRMLINVKKKKGVGRRYLQNELMKKGIAKEIIKSSLKDTGSDEDDLEAALKAAEKKLASLKKGDAIRTKLFRFLFSRGFSYETIEKTVRALDLTGDEE